MKDYTVIKLKEGHFKYLVIANTFENPINDFMGNNPHILDNIIFDLTLINGYKKNRFISGKIINDSEGFEFSLASISGNEVGSEIVNASNEYFKNNPTLVSDSILPNALKFLILNPPAEDLANEIDNFEEAMKDN